MIGDIIQSVGVVLSSALIYWEPLDIGSIEINGELVSKWGYVDSIITILFCVLVVLTTFSTIVSCTNLLMQMKPEHIDLDQINRQFLGIDNVVSVHDLHIWSLGNHSVICTQE